MHGADSQKAHVTDSIPITLKLIAKPMGWPCSRLIPSSYAKFFGFRFILDKSERAKFRHSSIKAVTDKKSSKKQRDNRIRGNTVAWGNAPIPEQEQTTSSLQSPGEENLAGNPGKLIGNTFRAGTLPAVITESKPMKDADRLLGVLTEHACVDSYTEEGEVGYIDVTRRPNCCFLDCTILVFCSPWTQTCYVKST